MLHDAKNHSAAVLRIAADASIPYLDIARANVIHIDPIAAERINAETLKDYKALIMRSTLRCDENLLRGTAIELLTTATAGFDHIDTAYCEANGISWRNAPGCNALSVAQYVMGCLCRLSMRDGIALLGKTIGIVGVGHVGKELQRLATAVGMNCLLCDPPRAQVEGAEGFVSLSEIAARADIISLHVPLTHEGEHASYHMIDEAFLSTCKRKPVLINACRGAVTATEALIRARKDGLLTALIIDCWEAEPQISKELLRVVDIATPHIAGFSANGKANASRACLYAISEQFDLKLTGIEQIQAPGPENPLIDLSLYSDHQIERALLHSFDPIQLDRDLRESVESFEEMRKRYNYHYEMSSYSVKGALPVHADVLRKLGFTLAEQ